MGPCDLGSSIKGAPTCPLGMLSPCLRMHPTDFVADMSHAYRGSSSTQGTGGREAAVGGVIGAYMAGADRFCARANTPHSYGEINR